MRLVDWAADPLTSGPPPIPLSTDVVNASNCAYRVGAIPPAALAEDLAAAGLTCSPGRGHGYRRHGERIDSYEVGDVIADIFAEAAIVLDYFLATDPAMLAIAEAEKELSDLMHRPYREVWEHPEEVQRARLRVAEAQKGLPLTRAQLVLVQQSLAATARSIRGILYVRTEAVRRFRSAIPAPARPRLSNPADVDRFLDSVPPGLIARTDLHADAKAAGLTVGSHTLYAAASALGWQLVKRRGHMFFRVPETH